MKVANLKTAIACMLFVIPLILGFGRDYFVSILASSRDVVSIPGAIVGLPECSKELCRQVYEVVVTSQDDDVAIGFHSAFGESIISQHAPTDSWKKRKSIDLNWFEFRTKTLYFSSNESVRKVWVECFSNVNSKKLGLENNNFFIGKDKDVRALEFVFKLVNVHLYLLMSLLTILFGAVVSFARSIEDGLVNRTHFFLGLLTGFTLIAFSHVLDSMLIGIGLTPTAVQVLPRILWVATIITISFGFKNSTTKYVLCVYLSMVVPGIFETTWGGFFLHGLYRWCVTSLALILMFRLFLKRLNVRFAPWVFMIITDALVLQGFIKLQSGLYLSPLGLLGAFATSNMSILAQIATRNLITIRSLKLKTKINAAKERHLKGKSDWEKFSKDSLLALHEVTGAKRISLFFKSGDSPIILTLNRGVITPIADGRIPPLFARVLQTKEEYWWIRGERIEELLGPKAMTKRSQYISDFAIVIPISASGGVYGIISLTDFEDSSPVEDNQEVQLYLKAIIRQYVDLVSAELIHRQESSKKSIDTQSQRLMEKLTTSSAEALDRISIITIFLDLVSTTFDAKALYFDLDPSSRRLSLLSTKGLTEHQAHLWQQIPFRARKENYISPFAVAVNERCCVFIDDVTHFFNLLEQQSVNTLTATYSKQLVVSPISFGDVVIGIVVLLDNGKRIPREIDQVLKVPNQYLSFKLAESQKSDLLEKQRRLLEKFVDPALAKQLVEAHSDIDALPIGELKKGVLIVQDLRGSTQISKKSKDPSQYAKDLYRFYCGADMLGSRFLYKLEITVGDSIIYMAERSPSEIFDILAIGKIVQESRDLARRTMGVEDVISIFHYGIVYKGIFGPTSKLRWDIAGGDFNDLFKMESAAKGVPGAVVAISDDFIDASPKLLKKIMQTVKHDTIPVKGAEKFLHILNDDQLTQLMNLVVLEQEFLTKNVS